MPAQRFSAVLVTLVPAVGPCGADATASAVVVLVAAQHAAAGTITVSSTIQPQHELGRTEVTQHVLQLGAHAVEHAGAHTVVYTGSQQTGS